MKKQYIFLIITGSILLLAVATFIIGIIVFIGTNVISLINEDKNELKIVDAIEESLIKYPHDDKIVYYERDNIYYSDRKIKKAFHYGVEFVDENCLITHDNFLNYYFLEKRDGQRELIETNCVSGIEGIYYKDNYIYSFSSNDYYQYDIDNKIETSISKNKYYRVKDGDNYSVDKNENKLILFENKTNLETIFTIDGLATYSFLSSIPSINSFKFLDYEIVGDCFYFSIHYRSIKIIISYNIRTKTSELYDWHKFDFDVDLQNRNIKFNITNSSVLPHLEKYFII